MDSKCFSGSYQVDDVCFLLTPTVLPDTPIHEKERLLQSGQKHYSQLLSHEQAPLPAYNQIFRHALTDNCEKLAGDLLHLAGRMMDTATMPIVLVSLARAGTPVGILLSRILKHHYSINAPHYSISILRDIGVDLQALRYLLQYHSPESLLFIDGWTGKGTIARQLTESLEQFSKTDGIIIAPRLYVLADLCGAATVAATSEDYLIPSCILNATVSGLISRTFYDPNLMPEQSFHGCTYYQHLEPYDQSQYFIDTVLSAVDALQPSRHRQQGKLIERKVLQQQTAQFLLDISKRYGVGHSHYIKPGIGEATRVLLRRKAKLLLLREMEHPSTQHLRWLAGHKFVPIIIEPHLPYQAAALISEV